MSPEKLLAMYRDLFCGTWCEVSSPLEVIETAKRENISISESCRRVSKRAIAEGYAVNTHGYSQADLQEFFSEIDKPQGKYSIFHRIRQKYRNDLSRLDTGKVPNSHWNELTIAAIPESLEVKHHITRIAADRGVAVSRLAGQILTEWLHTQEEMV